MAALLGMPGVTRIVEAEVDAVALVGPLFDAIDEATDGLIAMRAAEGESLAVELEGRIARVAELAQAFEERSGEVVAVAKQRLQKRAEQIKREVGLTDDARLHQEIVIAADRLDIYGRARSASKPYRAVPLRR